MSAPADPYLRPAALAEGDRVGIAAAASPVRIEMLAEGESRLRALGFTPVRAPHVLDRGRYTAGSAADRAADIDAFLRDPSIRAIWFARGGYGAPHLPPLLDPAVLRADPKLLIGASDLTALLLWALRAGVTCLHGPMPAREIAAGRWDSDELHRLLTRAEPFGRLVSGEGRVLHPGSARGRLVGGCLSLVAASLGTSWELETADALILLEDMNTKPYQIDRMLTQLRQAGKLDGAAGLLFGEMPGCVQADDQGYTLDEVLTDLTGDLGIPVVAGLPFGHTRGVHHALPLGVQATLETTPLELELTGALVS